MGNGERKQREKQERRRLILKAAMDLFLREGFDHVTMRHIAEAIDYSPAALYLSFNNKDEILFALRDAGFEELYRRERALAAVKHPLERLRRLGEVYVGFAIDNPEYYDLMFLMHGPAKMIALQHRSDSGKAAYDVLRANVQECIDAGCLRAADPDAATFALWSLVHGMACMIIRSRTMMTPHATVRAMVDGALDFVGGLMRADQPRRVSRRLRRKGGSR